MGIATKADLLGRWRIDRAIENRAGPDAAFEGEGVFAPVGDDLVWRETGLFRIAGGNPMPASRSYIWSFQDDRIVVFYEDGSPFHCVTGPDFNCSHLCGDDLYRGVYSFSIPESWAVEWTVTGPRKDYFSISRMISA